MKRIFTMLCFACVLFNLAKATETEPNNTKAQANTLALNGSNSGKINPAGDVDWYKVTTTGDGQLSVTLTPLSAYTYVNLYDNDGVTQLAGSYSSSQFTISKDGLAAGTYYLQVICYYNTDTSSYTISNKLVQPAQANDAEPDSTKAQALVLPLNGSKTGHVGYYYNNHRDTSDWYKVTTNGDGQLNISLNPVNGQYTYATLYDNDGQTVLNSQYSSSPFSFSKDGLAAGTYFIRVYCYYPTDFAPYVLSNTLTKPKQANDTEPDSTRAQALTLPLDDSVTGHIGYYYKNHRDTVDWYKVTTAADGLLRFTLNPVNGDFTFMTLYDNDGTTVLNSQYSSGIFSMSKDGLAAGTYYVKVYTFYSSDFAPYVLYDSLFAATPANDAEPDSTKAQALVLPLNGSKTGHVGYYYNNHRDTSDWYKVTTNKDGLLKISLNPVNGQYTYATLYDNDGQTVLNSQYSSSPFSFSKDGLAAGTYFIRVYCYYPTDFAPYVLSDSLFTYADTADIEPNGQPHLAKTLPVNSVTDGHVGFYYKNQRDSIDWFKINYTGSGALSVTLDIEPTKLNGGDYTYLEIYKDTNAAALYSQYTTTSLTANLASLTQGYYWVRVREYYNSSFETYSLKPTFTQVAKAKIKLVSSVSAPDCSATNSLTLQCSGSRAPYKVQLLRYDIAYGAVRIVPGTSAFTYSNLPSGVYSAKVYGDGATGNAFTKLTPVTLAPVPTNLTATNITKTQAQLNWTAQSCVNYYRVQYRKLGDTTWKTDSTTGNAFGYLAKALTAATSYEWHVAPVDSANGIIGTGTYSVLDTFKTKAATLIAGAFGGSDDKMVANSGNDKLIIYPNPAASQFTIQLNDSKLTGLASLWLRDMNGTVVWSKQQVQISGIKGMQVNVSNLAAGMYALQIVDDKNTTIAVKKIIVSR